MRILDKKALDGVIEMEIEQLIQFASENAETDREFKMIEGIKKRGHMTQEEENELFEIAGR